MAYISQNTTFLELFKGHVLGGTHEIFTGHLPADMIPEADWFEELWSMHPPGYRKIWCHGWTEVPRYSQSYGRDYVYSGQTNRALPVPHLLQFLLDWAEQNIEPKANGILINWYDGSKGHKIGPHRDVAKAMVPGSPIVTISFGEERVFRMRPWKGKGYTDFPIDNASVVIVPQDTNGAWTHEVPSKKKWQGRRISVTIRAFQ